MTRGDHADGAARTELRDPRAGRSMTGPEVAAYFEVSGNELRPRAIVASVWSPEMLGGRQLAALVAWAIERDEVLEGDYQPTRLTVDMFRPGPMRPLTLATRVVRAGHRIRVVDVSVASEGAEVSRGSVSCSDEARCPRVRCGPQRGGTAPCPMP